ncbi:conserved hypothetical protein, partial [Ricinus communis]
RIGRVAGRLDEFLAARIVDADDVVFAQLLGGAGVEGDLLVGVQRGAVFVVIQDAGALLADDGVRRQAFAGIRVLRVLVGRRGEVGRGGVAAGAQRWRAAQIGQHLGGAQVSAVRCGQAAALVGIDGGVEAPAVAFQVALAPGGGDALFIAAAFFLGLHGLRGHLRAFELGLGDEVDHAADGVGTVDRRGAVAQHFDAGDGAHRNHVQVGVAVGDGLVGQAAAVQQHQRAVHAQAAQVDVGAGAGVRWRQRGRLRQRHHEVGQRGHALLDQVFGLDAGDRQRCFVGDALDAGAGHFDAGHVGIIGLCGSLVG